jgi:hypothetical protein
MAGLNGSPITNVKFVDCNIEAQTGLRVSNVSNIDYSGLTLNVKQGDKIIQQAVSTKEND